MKKYGAAVVKISEIASMMKKNTAGAQATQRGSNKTNHLGVFRPSGRVGKSNTLVRNGTPRYYRRSSPGMVGNIYNTRSASSKCFFG